MAVYSKHYTREEARALLPSVRRWLEQLAALRTKLNRLEHQLLQLMQGGDVGGPTVNNAIRTLLDFNDVVGEFESRQIQIKDVERGLIDFPAFMGGKEVFLCWEKDEDDIEFWHDLETGYVGREKIE